MIEFADAAVAVDDFHGRTPTRRTIVHGLTARLAERRIALIGANGSGKSTILKLVNGLVSPTSGTVMVDGLDTRTRGRDVTRRVGYVFTDPLAQLVMSTPLDDIELSLRAVIRDKGERRRRALELLAERGLEHVAHSSIYDLSGGERQLVSLTTVLAIRPSIIVADEPTTLLDLHNRDQLRRVLGALDQQLIVSTHDLELAADADRILVIDAGRVAFEGPPADAIAFYRALMAARR